MTQGQALDILKSGANVFLTGEPGSGKSHTINRYVEHLQACGIEPSVTASTGIAATHIGGMTIHSWSGIGIKKQLSHYELDKLAQTERIAVRMSRARVLIIDEISMLEGETFNTLERVCRTVRGRPEPFGGLQVVVVGDFFQLPPISRPGEPIARFAFESPAWERSGFITCYLSEQYRQEDTVLLTLLSKLRQGELDEEIESILLRRRVNAAGSAQVPTKLFSHNADVDRINTEKLASLKGDIRTFEMDSRGNENLVSQLQRGCLSPERLQLKVGAAVMCTKNNVDAGYVNGTLGTVVGFSKENGDPIIETKKGPKLTISRAEWTVEDGGKKLATISQVPLRLAWAITVHKSQGMTLDEAVMDLSSAFEYGQGYVALSRVRSLAGLHLLGWNRRALEVHPKIRERDPFFREYSEEGKDGFAALSKDELTKLHRNFAVSSGGAWPPARSRLKKGKEKKTQMSTTAMTLALLREGKHASLKDLAKARTLTPGTILSHLEKLKQGGELTGEDLDQLFKHDTKIAKVISDTREVFAALGADKLTPIFSALGGKHSFDHIRIARLHYKRK